MHAELPPRLLDTRSTSTQIGRVGKQGEVREYLVKGI